MTHEEIFEALKGILPESMKAKPGMASEDILKNLVGRILSSAEDYRRLAKEMLDRADKLEAQALQSVMQMKAMEMESEKREKSAV